MGLNKPYIYIYIYIYRVGCWVTYRDDNCLWGYAGGMGWVGKWGDVCSGNGGDGERLLQSFLENIDRESCSDGSWERIPVFHNPHRKCRPSTSAVASTLE